METRGEFLPKRSEKLTGGQNITRGKRGKRREDRDKKKEMLGKEKKTGMGRKEGAGAQVDVYPHFKMIIMHKSKFCWLQQHTLRCCDSISPWMLVINTHK